MSTDTTTVERHTAPCGCAMYVLVLDGRVPTYEHPYVDDGRAGCAQQICAHGAKCGGLRSNHVIVE
jgi:hypothetical protein